MRKPIQVLIFPFYKEKNCYLYAIFKRRDLKFWQGISGGVENKETTLEAAKRELREETKIVNYSKFIKLNSMTTIPAVNFGKHRWGKNIYVVPEFSFGVELISKNIKIGKEHSDYRWLLFEEASRLLKYDSNKTALWELNRRLTKSKEE